MSSRVPTVRDTPLLQRAQWARTAIRRGADPYLTLRLAVWYPEEFDRLVSYYRQRVAA